jgi:hypothetical protein
MQAHLKKIFMQILNKHFVTIVLALCIYFNGFTQDIDYKKGMVSVDGKEYVKIDVKKQNFGLTKSFEVFSLSGTKIIIAAVATEFEQDKTDNSFLYYRLTFLTSNQVAVFKIPSLKQEKGFAELIGKSAIMVNDETNDAKVKEFIASKSITPKVAVDYTTVNRNKAWPIDVKQGGTIEQDGKIIGTFKATGSGNDLDYYEFALPTGVVIAKVSFTGGNNAQNFEGFTAKDNLKRAIPIPQKEVIKVTLNTVDKNYHTLKRIVKWLVDSQYL